MSMRDFITRVLNSSDCARSWRRPPRVSWWRPLPNRGGDHPTHRGGGRLRPALLGRGQPTKTACRFIGILRVAVLPSSGRWKIRRRRPRLRRTSHNRGPLRELRPRQRPSENLGPADTNPRDGAGSCRGPELSLGRPQCSIRARGPRMHPHPAAWLADGAGRSARLHDGAGARARLSRQPRRCR